MVAVQFHRSPNLGKQGAPKCLWQTWLPYFPFKNALRELGPVVPSLPTRLDWGSVGLLVWSISVWNPSADPKLGKNGLAGGRYGRYLGLVDSLLVVVENFFWKLDGLQFSSVIGHFSYLYKVMWVYLRYKGRRQYLLWFLSVRGYWKWEIKDILWALTLNIVMLYVGFGYYF